MVNLCSSDDLPVILVVDDQIDNVKVLALALELQNYSVTYALNGQEALQRLQAIIPDVILLDLFMPEMDGLEVCQRIKNDLHYQEIPILFLTASHEEEHLLKAFNKGASDYVTKPFKTSELLARVKTHVTLRRQAIELQRSKDKLETIVTHIQDGIIVVDTQGIIQFANPATARMFNQALPELIGHPLGKPIVSKKLTEIGIFKQDHTIGVAEISIGEATWDDQPVSVICLRDINNREIDE